MDLIKLRDQLITHEGFRLKPYRCTAGRLTIGVGRNLDDHGISREEAMVLLDNDIREAAEDIVRILTAPVWDLLSDARQRALVDMRFNLGAEGFREFKQLMAAIREGSYEHAAQCMLDSKWAGQVGERARQLARLMQYG